MMKKSSILLLLVTMFFASVTFYFIRYADAGADGLSSFVFIILFGVLTICCLLAFLLSLIFRKGQSNNTRNWIIGVALALPVLGLLAVVGVFGYFSFDYQKQSEIQVDSDKSVLTTQKFTDQDFGVTFNHVSGEVSEYIDGKPISKSITPSIENEILKVPVSDESYLDADFLVKLDSMQEITLSKFTENLSTQLQLDFTTEKVAAADFPLVSKDTEILMVPSKTRYEVKGKIGKYFVSEKQFESDLIYFLKPSNRSQTIFILIVSSQMNSAPAIVDKMSTYNHSDKNLWFHTLEIL